jgi:hypothetical protein
MSLKTWFGKGPKGDWVDIGAPKKMVSFKLVDVNPPKAQKENILNVCRDHKLGTCQKVK